MVSCLLRTGLHDDAAEAGAAELRQGELAAVPGSGKFTVHLKTCMTEIYIPI